MEVVEQPVARAGIYAPGGRAAYPSTVVMCAVTARAAGVPEIAVCSPPGGPAGEVHPIVLAACALCEVDEVYRVGGAQAIAALAYGTESVPKVDVISGPGNDWVTEAKRQVVGHVGIDGVAGPSELVVVAAGEVDAELIALDLLAQAEHGQESFVAVLSARRGAARRGRRAGRAAGAAAPERGGHGAVRAPDPGRARGDRAGRAACAGAPGARGGGGGGARGPGALRRLPVRRARRRHRLRRLRRRLQPRAADRRRGALPERAVGLPRSGAGWLAYPCPARRPLVSRPPAAPWPAPRAFPCTPSPWSAAHESQLAESNVPPARPRCG